VTEPSDRRKGVTYCIKVFVALRIGLFILGFLAATTFPARTIVTAPDWPQQPVSPGLANIVTSFERQDATWYLQIAATGYKPTDGSAAFFPLYPMTIRAVSTALGGHPLGASLLISNGALLAAIILLYFLTASELSESEAKRTILYLMVFPAAFFYFAPYSESLFLLCIVASFWGARRKKWAVAGLAGMLAALTRSVGVFLVPALAVVLAAIFLGEAIRPAQVAGGVVILAGVALLRRGAWPGRMASRSAGEPA
jgi:Gpi18-like mannosyltransferase